MNPAPAFSQVIVKVTCPYCGTKQSRKFPYGGKMSAIEAAALVSTLDWVCAKCTKKWIPDEVVKV